MVRKDQSMTKQTVITYLIIGSLAIGCLFGGGLWLKERAMAKQARAKLADANATIVTLERQLADLAARSRKPDESSGASVPTAPPSPTLPVLSAPDSEPLMVSTVFSDNAKGPPPMTEAAVGAIARFDLAMDREFDRLEQREQTSADQTEVTTIQKIKDQLIALDDLYRRADNATSEEERLAIRQEMQRTMGGIIGLSRVDRDERLGSLATQIGYSDPQAVQAFVREVDRIYRETHMDWTKLFNRGPPAAGTPSPGLETPPPSVSPGP